MYINNITKIPEYGKIALFADDASLIIMHKNIETAIEMANSDLIKIEEWLNSMKLKLNIDKIKWVLVGRGIGGQANEYEVKIGNQIIERVKSIKYLGFEIDEKLDFNEQVNIVSKKLASKINVLYRVSDKITFDLRKVVYNSIILPHFDYCSTLYLNCTREQIEAMQKLQNRAMRYILKCDYRTPSEFMLKTLNWMSVSQRINYNVIIFVFKMIKKLVPEYLYKKITYANEIHERNTRNRHEIRLPDIRTESARKCIFYNGIKLYNDIPNEVKNATSLNIFKKRLAMHIRELDL